jgi:ribosomal protein S18 acetylase RimI-like enzyme
MKQENSGIIRRFEQQDEPAVVDVWFRSGKAAYPFLQLWQTLTWPQAAEIFRTEIRSRCDIWVAVRNGQVVGYLAMRPPSYVDRLYVDPKAQRTNIGTMLLAFAKSISPGGLRLHTHQQNMPARKFYEKHGFQAVRFSISPPPESAPDVEYHWKGGDQQDLYTTQDPLSDIRTRDQTFPITVGGKVSISIVTSDPIGSAWTILTVPVGIPAS